jgi:hypothetical protein
VFRKVILPGPPRNAVYALKEEKKEGSPLGYETTHAREIYELPARR